MIFSRREIKDLLIAWLTISLAFAILFVGIKNLFSSLFLISLVISAFTVGIGFLLHELMHKYIAQKYGLRAEFYAFYRMLFLALAFSVFGFIIAAPGAVTIQGRITKEKNGKISLAGPLTNIILAILFLIPLLFFKTEEILGLFFNYGLTINSLLALFNLIPIMPFDGRKVYEWNKEVYVITVIFALVLFLSRYFI
ncbi:MAG: metalloprotease [Nanoarchaeota archaeon]